MLRRSWSKEKEEKGDEAEVISARRVEDTRKVLVNQLKRVLADLASRTDFYEKSWDGAGDGQCIPRNSPRVRPSVGSRRRDTFANAGAGEGRLAELDHRIHADS